ncbi:RNA polymerase sigma factor [uncultured Oscillibacter sp.]|uniref:RNA polymerase sigma factor n=1 Tax=uncultured Oscillibacter sp. TaxID=876091 RepID=UPI0025CD6274|nr:sigma-70 family RNA polymerase sigma factor [uncultured Oscillibacter sp.]
MERTEFNQAAAVYQDMVYRIALHYFANRPDAEDAVQEVFLRLYTRQDPFAGEEHLRRWLMRVTVNVCKDALKSAWRRRRVSLEEVPETPVFQEDSQAELYRAVMELPEKYRTVLNLFYYEELSVREIAQVLEVKETAVTTRLSRARDRLRQRLTEEVWRNGE